LYSKSQASAIKHSFWTAFGKFMNLQPSSDGEKVNWINYKTGIKHLHFKMEASSKGAYIAIEMSHPDPGIQELMFEQFTAFRNILTEYVGEEWEWTLHMEDEHYKLVSSIRMTLPGVSLFKQEEWPELISFFKPRIIALDAFWSDFKDAFAVFS
jgi:hypothetical protein